MELSQSSLRLVLPTASDLSKTRYHWGQVQTVLLGKKIVGRSFVRLYLKGGRSIYLPLFIYPTKNQENLDELLRRPYILGRAHQELLKLKGMRKELLEKAADELSRLIKKYENLVEEESKLRKKLEEQKNSDRTKVFNRLSVKLSEKREIAKNITKTIRNRDERKDIVGTLTFSKPERLPCQVSAHTITDSQDLISSDYEDDKKTYDDIYKLTKTTIDSAKSLSVLQRFGAFLGAVRKDDPEVLKDLKEKLESFLEIKRDADKVKELMQDLTRNQETDTCFEPRPEKVPLKFIESVSSNLQGTGGYWRGEARTYQAQPTERVQRISSVASAVNSMQMALSLAALLPGQGIGLDAGTAAANTAIGMVEAIERSPLVIGYTDRQSVGDQTSQSTVRLHFRTESHI